MENRLVQYVQRNGKTVGCVMASKMPGKTEIYISGSLCRRKADVFDKVTAITLAEQRLIAQAFRNRPCRLPYSLKTALDHITDRARRYFKGATVIEPLLKSSTPKKPANVTRKIVESD